MRSKVKTDPTPRTDSIYNEEQRDSSSFYVIFRPNENPVELIWSFSFEEKYFLILFNLISDIPQPESATSTLIH